MLCCSAGGKGEALKANGEGKLIELRAWVWVWVWGGLKTKLRFWAAVRPRCGAVEGESWNWNCTEGGGSRCLLGSNTWVLWRMCNSTPTVSFGLFSWVLPCSELMKSNKLAFNGELTCLSMSMCVSSWLLRLCVLGFSRISHCNCETTCGCKAVVMLKETWNIVLSCCFTRKKIFFSKLTVILNLK